MILVDCKMLAMCKHSASLEGEGEEEIEGKTETEKGICYPPMTLTFTLAGLNAVVDGVLLDDV